MASFYVDNDVAQEVAGLLSSDGHSVVTARDLQREADTDDEQLLVAAESGRVFLTHSERDFVLLHDAWRRWSAAWGVSARHSGIVIVPQGIRYGIDWDAEEITRAVVRCLQQCTPVAGRLLRRKEGGWQRREGRDWVACG